MAAARQQKDNPYDDGGGFGKFRKRPLRRVPATPYDRPSTAIRNPALATTSANNYGWLSKLVDPAQRLIASSAHKLFSSVFRKRLPPPPPPQPPEIEANDEAHDTGLGAVTEDPHGARRSTANVDDTPGSSSEGGGLTELELILKQKTFTRSEIDRLTSLLQSRTVDLPVGIQEKKSESVLSKGMLSQDRKEGFPSTPVKDNGLVNHHMSTPIVSSIVLNEDVASPTELAKAYMGSRPSISPSAIALRSRPVGDNLILQVDQPVISKSPMTSILPSSTGRVTSIENGIMTPRSRGRSAIYSMAGTPYSRVRSSSTLQGPRTETDVLSAQSLTPGTLWGSNKISGSKHAALKRRSSVMDNDMGSVGPIRRIRQKSNLLPSSGSHSIRGTGLGSDIVRIPSSSQKPVLAGEPSMDNGDNNINGSGFTSVPSKSTEMASKILQQLDVLTSSREKSPAKLSPSMLRGPALKSLENLDSSKLLETVRDNNSNKLDFNHDALLPAGQDIVSQKQDKHVEPKLIASDEKSVSMVNGVVPTKAVNGNTSNDKAISFPVTNSLSQPPQKRRAFRMSAHEDYLDLDDDDNSDRGNHVTLVHEREKLDNTSAENKIILPEGIVSEKPAASSQAKLEESSILYQKPLGARDGFAVAEKNSLFTVPAGPLPSTSIVQQSMLDKESTVTSDKTSSPHELIAAPPALSFGDKVVSPKEPNGFPTTSSQKTVEVPSTLGSTSPVSDSMGLNFGTLSNSKSGSSSSFTFTALDGTKSVVNEPESDKADARHSLKAGDFKLTETASSTVSTSAPATSIFSFGLANNGSNLNQPVAAFANSFTSSSPAAPFSSSAKVGSSNTTPVSTFANINSSSSSASLSQAPFTDSATGFKFGSSTVLSTSTKSETTGVELTENKAKEKSFENSLKVPFGSSFSTAGSTGDILFPGASSAAVSTGSGLFNGTSSSIPITAGSIFGTTSSAVASTTSSKFGSTPSAATSTGGGIFSFSAGSSTSATTTQSQGFNPFGASSAPASGAGTSLASTSQSMPIQFGSSASPFGLASSTVSSGSSLFSSSAFSSGATFGLSASTSTEANAISSSAGSLSTAFGSSWPAAKTPVFGTTFSSASPSTGFAFGASSASNASTSTASLMFGSSAGASSGTGGIFSFSSPAATTSQSQSVFGNTNSAFTYAPSPSSNNDQMNMEDSMAEDTVQATTSMVPAFGQQPTTPSSGFVFGSAPTNQFTPAAAPSGMNQFGNSAQSGANPFQFGASQNTLAAPASVEYNGGSFSLGSSGGGDKSNRRIVRLKKNRGKK